MRRIITASRRAVLFVLVFALACGAIVVASKFDLLAPLGVRSESSDTQVIRAIERTQEISLLSLSIQGINESSKQATIFGKGIPGTKEKVFLQYLFDAKLGIDGAEVAVTKTGEDAFRITIPDFIFIGYDDPTFKVAVEDGALLDWVAPDVDKVEMVNKVMNSDARHTYLESNRELLIDQTKAFYSSLIASVDPTVALTFEFRD